MTTQLRSFALKFAAQGGIVFPVDKDLHRLAVEYADRELGEKINFADYERVTVVCELDGIGRPAKVVALNCRIIIYDYPVWRASSRQGMEALICRTQSTLDDEGMRGKEVFIHVADHEPKESRCPLWRAFLRKVGARKASRWRVTV